MLLSYNLSVTCIYHTNRTSCPNPAVPGSDYCRQHQPLTSQSEKPIRLTDATLKAAIARKLTEHDFTLDTEVQMLTSLLEEAGNAPADNDAARLLRANRVADLIDQLSRTKEKNVNLRLKHGQFVTLEQCGQLISDVLSVAFDEVEKLPGHEEAIDRILARAADIVNQTPTPSG